MQIEDIIKLINAVSKSDVDSLNYSNESEKIVIRKRDVAATVIEATGSKAVKEGADYQLEEAEVSKGNERVVKSPIVGTFYSASSPDSQPYVKIGDSVSKGTVLGIIEAMKLMNEIESEFSGVVKEILVKDGDVVEYGQELFVIE